MQVEEVESVIHTWTAQFLELGRLAQVNHVQIFENRGSIMGASNPHPHGQIWATQSVPDIPGKELICQREYLRNRQACLLCDYLRLEQEQEVRLICGNQGFVALVPFWAVWPFELLICSRRHLGTLSEFSPEEVGLLAQILQQVTSAYDQVFGIPFPYSMGFHQTPTDAEPHPEWHLHAHFFPPLLRSATVRKFMVGFEMLGMPQRDITAETAAAHLRALCKPRG
jgi:UDPglucose--hexose-1-phosphate uridylyltransferase